MIRVFDTSSGDDLLPLSAFLWEQGIRHRISEEGGRQVLWVADASTVEAVRSYYREWQAGLLQLGKVKVSWRSGVGGLVSGPLADWRQMPVTLLLLAACLVVAAVTRIGANLAAVSMFTMVDFEIQGQMIRYPTLAAALDMGQYWRAITPIFLHFGIVHLLFNGLWLLILGHKLETRHRSTLLLILVLVTGLLSNILQFVIGDGSPLFGGMSGVIYGLLGFCWVREKANPGCYQIPSGIYMFMLVWLVIGFTGILGSFGFGNIANTAHAAGLFSGVACGWIYNRLGR